MAGFCKVCEILRTPSPRVARWSPLGGALWVAALMAMLGLGHVMDALQTKPQTLGVALAQAVVFQGWLATWLAVFLWPPLSLWLGLREAAQPGAASRRVGWGLYTAVLPWLVAAALLVAVGVIWPAARQAASWVLHEPLRWLNSLASGLLFLWILYRQSEKRSCGATKGNAW